jgi:hypothetical protein
MADEITVLVACGMMNANAPYLQLRRISGRKMILDGVGIFGPWPWPCFWGTEAERPVIVIDVFSVNAADEGDK